MATRFGDIAQYNKYKKVKNVFGQYNALQDASKVNYANALAMGQKGLKAIQAGYTGALGAANTAAAGAKQGVLDREKVNIGALKGGLADTGMLGGTLGANLERSVYQDTNTAMTGVDAAIAQIRAGLLAEQGEAIAGQYGALASLFQGQDASNIGIGSAYMNFLANRPQVQKGSGFGSLLGIGGQLGTAAILASDRRLKRDAVRVDGLEWEFSYVGQEGRFRGVMADEVEHIPGAVHVLDGYKHVDYSRVPVKFRRVA